MRLKRRLATDFKRRRRALDQPRSVNRVRERRRRAGAEPRVSREDRPVGCELAVVDARVRCGKCDDTGVWELSRARARVPVFAWTSCAADAITDASRDPAMLSRRGVDRSPA